MSISKLEVVLRLVSDEEKQAALMFKSVQDDFVSAEHALNQALAYRVEYEALSRGLRPSKFALLQLRAARSFLTNIDSLMNQRGILRAKYEVLEAKREQWQLLRAEKVSQRLFLLNVMRISLLTRANSPERSFRAKSKLVNICCRHNKIRCSNATELVNMTENTIDLASYP